MNERWLRGNVWPRFSRVLAREGIYLANHSLGRAPDRAAEDVRGALDAWYRDLDGAWSTWLEAREKFRALTAALVGAPSADCIVPKTSAGQGLRAVLNALEGTPRVVAGEAEFDSLDFILRVYGEKRRIGVAFVPYERLVEGIAPGTDLVVVSTVLFRDGQVVRGLAEIVRRAQACGAKVLLDVYHHAGVMPLDLGALGADFAVGGSYKYLRGGPGACWLYVHPRHHRLVTLDTGWFAKKDVFAYRRTQRPEFAPGGDAWLESTPPVLTPFQALAGLEFTLEIGVERIRRHSLRQKAALAELLRGEGMEPEGTGEGHGAFLTLRHPQATLLAERLQGAGVTGDARGELLRLCPDLLNGTEELERAARAIGMAMAK
jgi:kynureninase